MQSLWLIIVVFFLVLFILPIFSKIHVSYDILHNMGTLSLYIFFIKVFAYKVKFKNKNIILITEKKQKEIETEVSQKQMRFLEQLSVQLKQKIVIKKLTSFSRIGTGDASSSAIFAGLYNVVMSSIFAYIKNIKKSAKIAVYSEPAYNENHLTLCIYGSFVITIFDIIYSLIISLVIIKRSEKYERV